MKYLFFLLWFCTVFFFSCNDGLPDAEEADGEIEIFPDYKEVAIPCNIAPLNFKLKEPCEAIAFSPARACKYAWTRITVLSKFRRRNGVGYWTHRLEETLRSGSISAKMTDGFDILLFSFGLSKTK